jgi:hypothetical protein
VWTSAGQKLGDHQWGAGLVPGDNKAPVFVGGYSVRLNVDPASVDHSKDTYDVLDTTGKSVLQVPVPADQWNLNYVSLVDGYAAVSYDDSLAQTDHSTSRQHFTIYDLAVKAADGSAVASNYELSPLAFTADGSPVFIEVPASGTGITIGVGLGHAG